MLLLYIHTILTPLCFLQSFLVWQLLFAIFILGRRFLLKQVFGCLLVAVGVVVAVSRYILIFQAYFFLLLNYSSWCSEMCVCKESAFCS